MSRTKPADRYAWDRNARRVQPLATGVRVFDHTGRTHTLTQLADVLPLLDEIRVADPDCADRITLELDELVPGAIAAARLTRNRADR